MGVSHNGMSRVQVLELSRGLGLTWSMTWTEAGAGWE